MGCGELVPMLNLNPQGLRLLLAPLPKISTKAPSITLTVQIAGGGGEAKKGLRMLACCLPDSSVLSQDV